MESHAQVVEQIINTQIIDDNASCELHQSVGKTLPVIINAPEKKEEINNQNQEPKPLLCSLYSRMSSAMLRTPLIHCKICCRVFWNISAAEFVP